MSHPRSAVAPLVVVIRPRPANVGMSPERYRVRVVLGAIILLCDAPLLLLLRSWGHFAGWRTVLFIVGLSAFLLYLLLANYLYVRNATVFVRGEHLGITTVLGTKRVFATGDLAGVLLCSVLPAWRAVDPIPSAFFVSRSGGCLLELNTRQWDRDDLARICGACDVRLVGSWDDIKRLDQVRGLLDSMQREGLGKQ
jgi:hypothetical protein